MSEVALSAFEPLEWRGHVVSSRLMFAPINTGFADENGRPTDRLKRFHEERSGSAIGVSVLGNVAIHRGFGTNLGTPVLSGRSAVPRFASVAAAIRRRGSLPGIQLAAAPVELAPTRGWRVRDLGAEVDRLRGLVSGYSTSELESLMGDFLRGAELARDAGYSLIQVHAAHGYLFSLLLHPSTNRRRDAFAREGEWFPDFIGRLRDAAGEALVSIRFNRVSGMADQAMEEEACRSVCASAVDSGVDIVDLSAGAYTIDRRLIYPNRGEEPLASRAFARELLHDLDSLVAVAGNILSRDDVPSDLEDRLLLNVGRALIADPDFAMKLGAGRDEEINACRRTGRCHYFSRGQDALSCGSNPAI